MSEVTARFTGGRASKHIVRRWLNGSRRAPAWFVAVLVGEIERQISERQDILRALAEYKPQDRERRRAEAAALMRARHLAGDVRFTAATRSSGLPPGNGGGPEKNGPHN